jgi:hypothetical protein
VLIVKCLMIISKDTDHCDYLLKHYLGVSLQYIVRTDFELYRKAFDPIRSPVKQRRHPSSSSMPLSPHRGSSMGDSDSLGSPGGRSVSSSGSRSAFHSPSTSRRTGNYTVTLVRNSLHTVISTKTMEDINFKMTRLVILIYENVLRLGIHVIGDIVSSGLISGLLFRVGKGDNIDKRFLKLVNHFVYLLLIKLTLTQDPTERSMAVTDLSPPQRYTRAGGKLLNDGDDDESGGRGEGSGSMSGAKRKLTAQITNKLLKEKNEPVTVRTVTNKLHVQGVTELLITSLDSDEYDIIGDTLISLASMHFQTIRALIITERVLGKITGYAHTRRDCFYSGLALTADVSPSSPPSLIPSLPRPGDQLLSKRPLPWLPPPPCLRFQCHRSSRQSDEALWLGLQQEVCDLRCSRCALRSSQIS